MSREFKYEVALSFAGEQRGYVDRVADCLRSRGVSLFYDNYEEADLWGKNLYEHLTAVYRDKARFTIMFISNDYAKKAWTTLERRSAQSRAFEENSEYILPARFDETEIPGVLSTVGYIGLKDRSPEAFCEIIVKKLVSTGLTVPSEQLRKNLFEVRRAAADQSNIFTVTVKSTQGIPIQGAQILAVADNGTSLASETNHEGISEIHIRTRRLYDILIAHPHFPGAIVEEHDPQNSLAIEVALSGEIGSMIFGSTGHIPGLKGRINPICDSFGRTYVYADNIAINNGLGQPASFQINQPISFEDADGNITELSFKYAKGSNFLLQHTRLE